MSKKHPRIIAKLRMIRGQERYDAQGNILSEHQTHKIQYNSIKEWPLFKQHIQKLGFSKVVVLEVVDMNDTLSEKELETTKSKIAEELVEIYQPKPEQMTPDQKRIAELEKKIAAMSNTDTVSEEPKKEDTKKEEPKDEGKPVEDEKQDEGSNDDEGKSDDDEQQPTKDEVRAQWEKIFGKAPHANKSLEKMLKEIEDEKNK